MTGIKICTVAKPKSFCVSFLYAKHRKNPRGRITLLARMHRAFLFFAFVFLLGGTARATSMVADPTRKDLCGVWVGELDDRPLVIDLRPSGSSRWAVLGDDGRVVRSAFTWLCLPRGEIRFQMLDDSGLFILPIEGALVNRVFWDKLTILCEAPDAKAERRRIEFKKLSTAEQKLGPLLIAIDQAEKKEANQISEPTAASGRGSP